MAPRSREVVVVDLGHGDANVAGDADEVSASSDVARARVAELQRELDAMAEASRSLLEENARLRTGIDQMTLAVAAIRRDIVVNAEAELVQLAFGIAKRVVACELDAKPERVVAWVHEALAFMAERSVVTLYVSTYLGARIDNAAWAPLASEIRVHVDPQLEDFACRVVTPAAMSLISADARLTEVSRELLGDAP